MDQSSSRMTSCGRRLDGLASLHEGYEDELLLNTDELLEEYTVLGLDMLSSEPMQIDRLCSLVVSLSLDIPTYKRRMKTKIPLHFLHIQTNDQKKKWKEKRKGKIENGKRCRRSYLGNG